MSGLQNQAGGRMGDSFSTLSDSLRELGFEVGRFKTGTPCRLHGKTIDFPEMPAAARRRARPPLLLRPGAAGAAPEDDIFSLNHWADGVFHVEQLPCWMTYTNAKTHDIIRANLDKSPLYAGMIEGVGPRYCPSIEDKVVKFAEKTSHQLFLEPEGRHTEEIYVNGVSTSLPIEVQYAFIRTVPASKTPRSCAPVTPWNTTTARPRSSSTRWKRKRIPRLYFAGQINGTSGYEEAGAQGPHRRRQRRAQSPRQTAAHPDPRRRLHRRAHRRPRDQRHARAVPDVHQPRRTPPPPPPRQR